MRRRGYLTCDRKKFKLRIKIEIEIYLIENIITIETFILVNKNRKLKNSVFKKKISYSKTKMQILVLY